MMRQTPYCWIVRISWPLLGGAWGAWLGYRGYVHLPSYNADSAGSLLVSVFFLFFAVVGLFAGAASGALIGGLVEWFLRRSGARIVTALSVATLVNALVLWQIVDFIQVKYPGLRANSSINSHRSNETEALIPADKSSYQMTCSSPRPIDPKERVSWDAECR